MLQCALKRFGLNRDPPMALNLKWPNYQVDSTRLARTNFVPPRDRKELCRSCSHSISGSACWSNIVRLSKLETLQFTFKRKSAFRGNRAPTERSEGNQLSTAYGRSLSLSTQIIWSWISVLILSSFEIVLVQSAGLESVRWPSGQVVTVITPTGSLMRRTCGNFGCVLHGLHTPPVWSQRPLSRFYYSDSEVSRLCSFLPSSSIESLLCLQFERVPLG